MNHGEMLLFSMMISVANNDLYELGHVISGGDIVSELSGTVTIETISNQ